MHHGLRVVPWSRPLHGGRGKRAGHGEVEGWHQSMSDGTTTAILAAAEKTTSGYQWFSLVARMADIIQLKLFKRHRSVESTDALLIALEETCSALSTTAAYTQYAAYDAEADANLAVYDEETRAYYVQRWLISSRLMALAKSERSGKSDGVFLKKK